LLLKFWCGCTLTNFPYITFLLLLTILLEGLVDHSKASKLNLIGLLCSVFFFAYIDPSVFFIYLFFLLISIAYFNTNQLTNSFFWKVLFFPTILAGIIYGLQIYTIKFNYPNIYLEGSGLLFRTGLDGSIEHYKDHLALFTRRENFKFLGWYFLFFGGIASLILFMSQISRHLTDAYIKIVVSTLLCAYLPFAFIMSQGTVIHPYYMDPYLAMPMVLLMFCFAPAICEILFKNSGGFSLFFLVTAFCYTFVQLRSFMISYPLSWIQKWEACLGDKSIIILIVCA
jgi:hypothetical protein